MMTTHTSKISVLVALLVVSLTTASSEAWPGQAGWQREQELTLENNLTPSVDQVNCTDESFELSFQPEKLSMKRSVHQENEATNLKVALGFLAATLGAAILLALSSRKGKLKKKTAATVQVVNGGVIKDGFFSAVQRMERVDLVFDGVMLGLNQKGKKPIDGVKQPETRLLLDGSIKGRARPRRMLAIMGPSGAGKSVFLHALAGRIKSDKKLSLSGDRYMNGNLVDQDEILPAAFVEQEVNFFPRMTARETLDFRVALHFGDLLAQQARDGLVLNLLTTLGLLTVSDTIVGDSKIRGLSPGERKRLSIAVEMIASPGLVCCDEPTSGLDSAAAAVVIEKLRGLANRGKTVICVIHQPSSALFKQFDDLLLISEGKQMYSGPVSGAKKYMETLGYVVDNDAGTAEHILECVSPLPRMGEEAKDAEERLEKLTKAAVEQAEDMDLGIDGTDLFSLSVCSSDSSMGPRTGMWTQFLLLFKRALAENFRAKDVIMIKTMQQVVVALVYGGIYTLGNNQASIMDRFGLLSLTAIGGTNMAIATTLRAFPKEKTIASAEIAIKQYRALPYFVAKAISEFPLALFYNCVMGVILFFATGMNPDRFWSFLGLITLHALASEASGMAVGAVSPSSDVALALFPPILILNIVFDGRNISLENTPYLLRWVPKVSLIRWGFEGLALNEFRGLEFNVSDATGPVASNGEEALAMYGLADASFKEVVLAQSIIMVVCWCLAYAGLTLTKQRFVEMKHKQ